MPAHEIRRKFFSDVFLLTSTEKFHIRKILSFIIMFRCHFFTSRKLDTSTFLLKTINTDCFVRQRVDRDTQNNTSFNMYVVNIQKEADLYHIFLKRR